MSLINLISPWGAVFGLVVAAVAGDVYFGWRGLLVGAVLGACTGLVLGRVPLAITVLAFRVVRSAFASQSSAQKDNSKER